MSYESLVRFHLAFGSIALAGFWLQMVARKGGRGHRVGEAYGQPHFILAFVLPTVAGMVAASPLAARYGPPDESDPLAASVRID